MSKRRVTVCLDGDTLGVLRRQGVGVSTFVRECVERCLADRKVSDGVLAELMLRSELNSLYAEDRRLVRAQVLILRNCTYLNDYVETLIKGGEVKREYRESILSFPNADKVLPAVETIFARRQEIGLRVAEIQTLLYPNYAYEPLKVLEKEQKEKRSKQTVQTQKENWDKKRFQHPHHQAIMRDFRPDESFMDYVKRSRSPGDKKQDDEGGE